VISIVLLSFSTASPQGEENKWASINAALENCELLAFDIMFVVCMRNPVLCKPVQTAEAVPALAHALERMAKFMNTDSGLKSVASLSSLLTLATAGNLDPLRTKEGLSVLVRAVISVFTNLYVKTNQTGYSCCCVYAGISVFANPNVKTNDTF
jgi:hypothetical protein